MTWHPVEAQDKNATLSLTKLLARLYTSFSNVTKDWEKTLRGRYVPPVRMKYDKTFVSLCFFIVAESMNIFHKLSKYLELHISHL